MTTLSNIRDIETRLHSHFLEWDDKPLQNELLWILDELQQLHERLDYCDVPSIDMHSIDMTLLQRLNWLAIHYIRGISEHPKDEYGKPIDVDPQQLRLF